MLDHFCVLNDEEGFLESKTNSWTLLVCFHSLLRLRDRRLKGEGKDIPGAHEPRMLLLPWQLYHNYPRPTSSAPSKTIPDSHRGERETRVTSDEAQGTMERRCERWSRFLLPAFLCPYQPLPGSFPFPPLPFSKWKDLGGTLVRTPEKDVFEQRTSTGSEAISVLIYLDSTKCVSLRVFTLIKTIPLKI